MVYVAKASYISDEEAREIVRLHDQEKKTFKEIAKILGRSVSGVRRAYRRYKESVSRDKGEIEAKLIRAFKNGLTPTEVAEKYKIPLKTVKEVWELYSDLEKRYHVVKHVKKDELLDVYVEDWDMTLGEFLDRLTYEVRQVLSFKDRQDFFEERLNTLNKSFEDLNGKVIELRKSLDSLRNQHLEDRRSLSSHIEKRLEEIEERLEYVEKFISELKGEREKKKKPLLKRILSVLF